MREGNVLSLNESARGWSLREANVWVSTKGAPHDGQDTAKTLRTIVWYDVLVLGKQCDSFLSPPQPLKKNVVVEQLFK